MMFRNPIRLPLIYIDVPGFKPFIICGSYRNDTGLPAANGHNLIWLDMLMNGFIVIIHYDYDYSRGEWTQSTDIGKCK